MKVRINTEYTESGLTRFEVTTWVQVGVGNPKGVTLPNESGLWMLNNVSAPAREVSNLIIPSGSVDQVLTSDASGNQQLISVPSSAQMSAAYWDYFSLPLRAGVALV